MNIDMQILQKYSKIATEMPQNIKVDVVHNRQGHVPWPFVT